MVYEITDFVSSCDKDFVKVCGFKRKPFKSKFVLSQVWKDLDQFRGDIGALTKYFKQYKTDVIIGIPEIEFEKIPIGGYYTPDLNRIELILTVKDFDNHQFTDRSWWEFKFLIIQVMCHEIVHMMQFVNRDFFWSYRNCKFRKVRSEAKNENRKYHASLDEIQAYAHCIYLELKQFGFDIPKTKKDHHNFKLSITFNMILNVFGKKMNEPVITKTMFHVKQWKKKYESVA